MGTSAMSGVVWFAGVAAVGEGGGAGGELWASPRLEGLSLGLTSAAAQFPVPIGTGAARRLKLCLLSLLLPQGSLGLQVQQLWPGGWDQGHCVRCSPSFYLLYVFQCTHLHMHRCVDLSSILLCWVGKFS